MSDIATLQDYPLPVISTMSATSIGLSMIGAGGSQNTTGAWPSSNLAIFVPFVIGYQYTGVKMFWYNGATVGTNHVDVGIYDSQGNQLVHSGSTLTSGGSAVQSVTITSTTLEPGLYYLAMAVDGTTDTFQVGIPAADICASHGVLSMATAFTLPATATYATTASAYIPVIGVTSNTVL